MTERLHKIQDLGKILSLKWGNLKWEVKYRERQEIPKQKHSPVVKFDKQNR